MDEEEMHPRTRKDYHCKEHDLFHVKNAMGQFVCPFCEADY